MKFEVKSTSGSLGKAREVLKGRLVEGKNYDHFVEVKSLGDLMNIIKKIGTECIIQPKAMYRKKGDTYGANNEHTWLKDDPEHSAIEIYDDYRE